MKISKAVDELERENVKFRRALQRLVDRYICNPGSEGQFVACITPNGNMLEWDAAMTLLDMKLHPKRMISNSKRVI